MTSVRRALAVLGCAFIAHSAPALAQADGLATAVKATYLYKFAAFVEWPESPVPESLDPPTFDICVVGDDPFGAVLDEAVASQSVRSQRIRIRRFPSVEGGAAGCEIMYVAGSKVQSIADALEETKGFPVLTVTDGRRSSKSQGMIHFVEQEGRIRFSIDNVMADESGLAISSKLLDLAISVRTKSGPSRMQ